MAVFSSGTIGFSLRPIETIRQIVLYDTIFTGRINPIFVVRHFQMLYDTFRCCMTLFSLISVGFCKYPVKDPTPRPGIEFYLSLGSRCGSAVKWWNEKIKTKSKDRGFAPQPGQPFFFKKKLLEFHLMLDAEA
jgi:hypothetical protein